MGMSAETTTPFSGMKWLIHVQTPDSLGGLHMGVGDSKGQVAFDVGNGSGSLLVVKYDDYQSVLGEGMQGGGGAGRDSRNSIGGL